MAAKIEVILNGVGSILIEHDDETWSKEDVALHASAALGELVKLAPERRAPIGFGAGDGGRFDFGNGSETDPTDMGWVER